jgi:S1-C subfamily serine protease
VKTFMYQLRNRLKDPNLEFLYISIFSIMSAKRKFLAAILLILLACSNVAYGQINRAQYVLKRIYPSVVTVTNTQLDGRIVQGSGVVVRSSKGSSLIATNAHVAVAPGDITLSINGMQVEAKIRYRFPQDIVDLAFLEASIELPAADLGDFQLGDEVWTIGSPLGLERSLSTGIISGERETEWGIPLIQITAPISPGSSGGALSTPNGTLIGITTSRLARGEQINFAIGALQIPTLIWGIEAAGSLIKADLRIPLAGLDDEDRLLTRHAAFSLFLGRKIVENLELRKAIEVLGAIVADATPDALSYRNQIDRELVLPLFKQWKQSSLRAQAISQLSAAKVTGNLAINARCVGTNNGTGRNRIDISLDLRGQREQLRRIPLNVTDSSAFMEINNESAVYSFTSSTLYIREGGVIPARYLCKPTKGGADKRN